MPIYEYVCGSCGAKQEHIHKISDPKPPCEACGADALDRQITAAGFRFRGSAGWGGIQEGPNGNYGYRVIEGE